MRVLAGDIGGTHARLAIVELGSRVHILAEQTVASRDVQSPAAMMNDFLAKQPARPAYACLGIAGPVVDGVVTGTNLPWVLEAHELGQAIGIPSLRLINDFQAAAHALPLLASEDLLSLQEGVRDPLGAIALIGAGTGLGEGFLVRAGDRYSVQASEGGHSSFAPEDQHGWDLFQHLAAKFGHVSWERILSGPGLVNSFEFVATGRQWTGEHSIREAMARGDPAAVISRHALAGTDPVAVQALDLFVEAYGAQAGNLALTVLATGGVYVAGGIARQIAPKLADGTFMRAFLRKGRMTGLLERLPVQVILNPDVGLLGAAAAAGAP